MPIFRIFKINRLSGNLFMSNANDKSHGLRALLIMRGGSEIPVVLTGVAREKKRAPNFCGRQRFRKKPGGIISSTNQDRWSIMAATGWLANPSPTYPSGVGRVRGWFKPPPSSLPLPPPPPPHPTIPTRPTGVDPSRSQERARHIFIAAT